MPHLCWRPLRLQPHALTKVERAFALQREVLFAFEDGQRLFDRSVSQGDGGDGLRQANCLVQAALMDIAARSVAAGATNVNLVVQLGKEGLGVNGGAACAHQARTTGSSGSDLQSLGRGARVLAFRLRRIDLDEVGAQAQGNARSTRNEIRVFFGLHSLAARVNPQHNDETLGVGALHPLGGRCLQPMPNSTMGRTNAIGPKTTPYRAMPSRSTPDVT